MIIAKLLRKMNDKLYLFVMKRMAKRDPREMTSEERDDLVRWIDDARNAAASNDGADKPTGDETSKV